MAVTSIGSGIAAGKPGDPVELIVGPRPRDLMGFAINRVWPTARRRLIGPFVFLDHMRPVALVPGTGFDVPPHPHIGLATVTFLFEGELVHRDSLGIEQLIRPGDVNWMTAGRGIVHSERSSRSARSGASRLHGTQAWVALPTDLESVEPSFDHVSSRDLPRLRDNGVDLVIIAGTAFGETAPVETRSELFYVSATISGGRKLALDETLGQRAAYVVAGRVSVDGQAYESGRLLVFADGSAVEITAETGVSLMLLGGAPLDGDRLVWWNFVATDRANIERAKVDWREGRFAKIPGESGSMPLPE